MKAAIKELMDDHQVILRMLGALRGMAARIEAGSVPDAADAAAAADFIKTFADRCHHGKEEDLLFPAMEAAGIPSRGGPVGVMLAEHVQGREFARGLASAAARAKAGESGAWGEFARHAGAYADLLAGHIFKEDRILYPMALEAVAEERWEGLSREFARVEADLMGPAKRAACVELVDRLARAYPCAEPVVPSGPLCG